MTKLKIKKGDNVLILAGKENGKSGEILECFPAEGKVTVKGLNVVVKHRKPRSAQDKGGIVKLEGKIDISDVMVICPVCNKATRVKMGLDANNRKVRLCKKCGAVLDSGAKKQTKTTTTKSSAKSSENKEEKKSSTKTSTEKKSSVKKSTEAKSAESKTTVKDTKKHETKSSVKAVKSTTVKKTQSSAKKIGGK